IGNHCEACLALGEVQASEAHLRDVRAAAQCHGQGAEGGAAQAPCPHIYPSLSATAPMTMSAAPATLRPVTRSFNTVIDMIMTNRMLVSRKTATAAIWALVIAQMTIQ